jgi:hypothetical protein
VFEIIGLLIDIAVFLTVGAILGAAFAFLAWLLLRKRTIFKIAPILGAAAVPVLSAIWIIAGVLFFAVAFPGRSYTLFGDIVEPLPNGYYLMALGKMPDFAQINHGSDFSSGSIPLSKCVGGIALDGPLVVGAYSHPFGQFTAEGNQGFFLFDTRSGAVHDYETLREIETSLGHPVAIVRVDEFHSQQPFYLRDLGWERFLLFAPPVAAILAYLAFLVWLRPRHRTQAEAAPAF